MPDLSGIWALARRLGAVARDGSEGDTKGDASLASDHQVKRGCHPVTPVAHILTSQPESAFKGVQPENRDEINGVASQYNAENAYLENLEDWKIRYLERAAVREFDANLRRAYAERAAWEDIVAEWAELHATDGREAERELLALGLTRPLG